MFAFWWMKFSGTPHEKDFYAVKLFNPPSDQVFVDIGSNRGEGILSALLVHNQDIDMYGFEPNPLVYDKLQAYYAQNKKIKVHNVGLADRDSEHELFVPYYRKWMFDGLASFDYHEAKDWLKTRLWLYDEKS